jgi:hypothetical protein
MTYRRLIWVEHVVRMVETRNACIILVEELFGAKWPHEKHGR